MQQLYQKLNKSSVSANGSNYSELRGHNKLSYIYKLHNLSLSDLYTEGQYASPYDTIQYGRLTCG